MEYSRLRKANDCRKCDKNPKNLLIPYCVNRLLVPCGVKRLLVPCGVKRVLVPCGVKRTKGEWQGHGIQ